jgi:hypothetical protein
MYMYIYYIYNIMLYMAKKCSVMVNALEPHTIGARFDPLACLSLMVPSAKLTLNLAFSCYTCIHKNTYANYERIYLHLVLGL